MSQPRALAIAALWLLLGGMPAAAEAALRAFGVVATAQIASLDGSGLDLSAITLESDDDIKAGVTTALATDPGLAGSAIEVVSVEHGVVLLAGETGPLTNQLRAIATASRVPGVREVRTLVGSAVEPTIEPAPEVDLARADPPDGRARLGVDDRASHGDQPRTEPVRLDPSVAAAADKVEEAVTGTVSSAGSSMVRATRDAWITAATKTALLATPDVPALEVDVDTTDGVVTLFGIVSSRSAKSAAAESAGAIAGVRAVDNALEVVPVATQERVAVADEQLQTFASRALEQSRILEGEDVSVRVKNGVARLTGYVSTNVERLAASSMVRATPGVRAVNNDLRVASE